MDNVFGVSNYILDLSEKVQKEIEPVLKKIDEICSYNSLKVLEAFQKNRLCEAHFNSTTGYGYGDIGREAIEKIYSDIMGAEDSLVRSQFISGSHALTVTLFALLRPGDTLLSISGKPYDTLEEVIGIKENASSLKSFNVNYEQIDLINDDFNYEEIEQTLKTKKIKVIEIQRSKGYSTRKSITIEKLEKVIRFIKNIDKDVTIMIDNCYCEFVEKKTPLMVGADIIVGSLIKNLGGGIAPNGAYICGRKDLIDLCGERLTLPGEGREVGPTLGINKSILQGLFFAPSVVASSLKTADIVQNIEFGNAADLIKFCQGIQQGSPVDSFAIPEPWDMPGYVDKVIMAAGAFTQGSSIELSCDGPIRSPYIAYLQGGLTFDYGKLGVMKAASKLVKE